MARKKTILVILSIILIFLLVSCKKEIDKNSLPRVALEVDYVLNVGDMREVVGFADFFFIGEIIEDIETIYQDGEPHTRYKVKVIKNIKGELPEEVEILKWGGVTKDNQLFLPDSGELPEKGGIYAISVVVDIDGNLMVSGENSSSKVEQDQAPDYEKYVDYYKNEVPYDRERNEYKETKKKI